MLEMRAESLQIVSDSAKRILVAAKLCVLQFGCCCWHTRSHCLSQPGRTVLQPPRSLFSVGIHLTSPHYRMLWGLCRMTLQPMTIDIVQFLYISTGLPVTSYLSAHPCSVLAHTQPLTTPNHAKPSAAPNTIATAGGTLNHAVPAYATVATTTHHGSSARLLPSLLSTVK